ncbi:hypothetical protein PAXRUDRAFT_146080, partial [Paxillus rubicundulus Ve08.2h10]
SGKKHSNQGWWWDDFTEHPGYANKEETSMVSSKEKVTCAVIFRQHITWKQQLDQEHISSRQ